MNEYISQIEPQYQENLNKVTSGEWSLQTWYEYCSTILGEIMLRNQDLFQRLKDR